MTELGRKTFLAVIDKEGQFVTEDMFRDRTADVREAAFVDPESEIGPEDPSIEEVEASLAEEGAEMIEVEIIWRRRVKADG